MAEENAAAWKNRFLRILEKQADKMKDYYDSEEADLWGDRKKGGGE
jgi:hypothetical protein